MTAPRPRRLKTLVGAGSLVRGSNDPDPRVGPRRAAELARKAEAAKITGLFTADLLQADPDGLAGITGSQEPIVALAALSGATADIGLVATVSTTFHHPYNLARLIGTLDHASGGRAAWNAVTSSVGEENFGGDIPDPEARYARATEFVEVVNGLFDAHAPDAATRKGSGAVAVDPRKLGRIDYRGRHFDVQGPLNVPPTPQGRPVLFQAGQSEHGVTLGARYAEVVYTSQPTLEGAHAFARELRRRARSFGRAENLPRIMNSFHCVMGESEADVARRLREKHERIDYDQGRLKLADMLGGGIDLSNLPLDRPIPERLLPRVEDVRRRRGRVAIFRDYALAGLSLRELIVRAQETGHWFVAGTPEALADAAEERFRAGVLDVVSLHGLGQPDQESLLLDGLLPALRRRGLIDVDYVGANFRANLELPNPDPIRRDAGAPPAEQPVEGGTLVMGLASDTAVIDPSVTGSSVTALIARNLVDSLVGQAEDNAFTPWLAERWEVNQDNTVYTFHLRGGVTFSDGTRLDAAAVKANFDRILDPRTTSSYAKSLLGPVSAIEASDERTVVIRYGRGFAPLLQGLSLPYLGIQSPAALKEAAGAANTVVGSGPFTLASFVRGQGSRLDRRPDYAWGPGYAAHRGPAHLDHIAFRYLPEASVRLGALTSGQLQAIDAVPPTSLRAVQADGRLQVITRENPGVNATLLLNTSRGPFGDVAVRQAFQSAVDEASAVRAAYFGTLKPATNILGPSTLDDDPRVAGTWGFDLAKANRLLDAAGWTGRDGDGTRTKGGQRLAVRFLYDSAANPAADVTLAQAVQFQVKQAGFDLGLEPVDAGAYTSRTAANDYDIAFLYYVRAEPDILRTVFSSAFAPPNGANFARVASLDDRLAAAVGAAEPERGRLYGEVQAEIVGQAYAVPLYVAAYELGASKALHGVSWATNAKPNFYDAWLAR